MLRRALRWLLYFFVLIFFAVGAGMSWLVAVPVLLVAGWLIFLVRTIPEVEVAPGDLAFACVCLAALGIGAHHFLRWLFRTARGGADTGDDAPGWQPRWTGALVALFVLLFIANIATVGVIHQLGWIATADTPLLRSSWGTPYFKAKRLCTSIKYSNYSPDELRVAIWRDPELRKNARDLHVLVREDDEGEAIAAVFPRGPAALQRAGLRVCGAKLDESIEAVNALDVLRMHGFSEAAQRLEL